MCAERGLEGVFAQGQVYVRASRVTDPQNFVLVGLPPKDLLDVVASAWREAGLDVDECFRRAVQVSEEWDYLPTKAGSAATRNVARRLRKKEDARRQVPVRLRTLQEALDPQPETAAVLHRLLDWMDRYDVAMQHGWAKPAFQTITGEEIFPDSDEAWWLTEMSKRGPTEAPHPGDEDGPWEEDQEEEEEDQENDIQSRKDQIKQQLMSLHGQDDN